VIAIKVGIVTANIKTRELPIQEKEQMLIVFALLEPVYESNNQMTITEQYHHANKIYIVTYFAEETVVEEVLNDF